MGRNCDADTKTYQPGTHENGASTTKAAVIDALDDLAEHIREHGDADALRYLPKLNKFDYDPADGAQLQITFVNDEMRINVRGEGVKMHADYDLSNVYNPEMTLVSYSPRYRTPQFRFHVGGPHGELVEFDVTDARIDRREN